MVTGEEKANVFVDTGREHTMNAYRSNEDVLHYARLTRNPLKGMILYLGYSCPGPTLPLSPECFSLCLTAPFYCFSLPRFVQRSSQNDGFKLRSDDVTCLLTAIYKFHLPRIASKVQLLALSLPCSLIVFTDTSVTSSPDSLFP
jgi:hypothetical protein